MATQTIKSAVYVWEGTDRNGNKTKGEVESSNASMAKAQLRKQGISVKKVKKKAKPLFNTAKPITPMDIAVFTRQMATMMKAGVPLVQSFDIVAEGIPNPSLKNLILGLKADVSAGGSFADSLEKHPKHFDELFCSLVNSGEQAGALETMLDRVATYKEKNEALKAKIKKALTYPIAVVVVALIVTGILLMFVVPQFAETFSSFGSDLPAFTQLVLDISNFVQESWYIIIGILVGLSVAYSEASSRSKKFRDFIDALMLKIPVVGHIVYTSVIARFARTLATTFAAGVPLVEALDSVAGAAGNVVFYRAIRQIRDDVTSGIQLYQAIKTTGLFPIMLLQMVSIGEESGALDEMLEKVALHYEEEVDNAVDGLTAMLEPFIMSVLGVLIGGLMIAMYLPIFMMGSVV